MVRETRAKSLSYDASRDALTVRAEDPCGDAGPRDGQLLVDARGFLVGVDLGGDGLDRLVVMLGPHEAVARTVRARVEVAGASVTVSGAKRAARGDERSPYV